MNILLLLIPLSLMLLVVAIGAFVWAVRRGQFDDLDAAAIDILAEDAMEEHARPAERRDAD
jgi:cbb3-type cytochrome oxidase maturation protein